MTSLDSLDINAAEVEDLILTLGAVGAHSGTGVWRTAFSQEWMTAQDMVRDWGQDAGLAMRYDAAGNLWGRAEGTEGGKAIVSGSHIDSQCPGGRYDGALGVLSALVAIRSLTKAFGPPKVPLEMVSLCEEESSRFSNAGFWGSRAIVGRSTPEDCETVVARDGTTIGAAMQALGFDPAKITEARRNDIGAFIELHIEQGPNLEAADLPVAVVDAITHIREVEVTYTGTSNHAGAFPMDGRRDPMAGFAEAATAVINHAIEQGRPAVTTVGKCVADPGAPAIIPRSVTFTVDSRHPVPEAAIRQHKIQDTMVKDIAERRGLGVETRMLIDHPACLSDPALLSALDNAAKDASVPYMRMASGAGHDAQQMSVICPVAMIFVRSEDGRSHTPEEFSTIEDIVAGIRVLAGALYRLAY